MSQKIVLKSLINLSGTRANVQLGDRPLATIYRRGGTWHAMTPAGVQILPPTPVVAKRPNKWGKPVDTEIGLGEIIKTLRERLQTVFDAKRAAKTQIAA